MNRVSDPHREGVVNSVRGRLRISEEIGISCNSSGIKRSQKIEEKNLESWNADGEEEDV